VRGVASNPPIYPTVPWETLNISPPPLDGQQRTRRPSMELGSSLPQFVHCGILLLSLSYPAYCMQDHWQTGGECCLGLLPAHDSGLSGGHGQGVNSTRVTSIAYPGAIPGPPFSDPITCEEGSSFHFHQQRPAYAIPPQELSCHYTSQVPATISDRVLCVSGGDQHTGAYPAATSAPSASEPWDAQVS